jgi:hypothetical protein
LTKKYAQSENCVRELKWANRKGKKIVYLMIEQLTDDDLGDDIAFLVFDKGYIE